MLAQSVKCFILSHYNPLLMTPNTTCDFTGSIMLIWGMCGTSILEYSYLVMI